MPTHELSIRPRDVAHTSHGIQRVKGWVLRQVSNQSDAVKRLPYPIGHDGIGASSYPVQCLSSVCIANRCAFVSLRLARWHGMT